MEVKFSLMQINQTIILDTNMNTKYFVIVAAIAAVLVGATGIATADNAFAGKKREYSQASSQANACGNGEMSINVGCQNTDSQIQGDENGVAQTAQQTFSEVELDNGHDRDHKDRKGGMGW
ncbi:MAG: hypothetical protein WBX01_09770 [Nitrososphaeraceae archaeon]